VIEEVKTKTSIEPAGVNQRTVRSRKNLRCRRMGGANDVLNFPRCGTDLPRSTRSGSATGATSTTLPRKSQLCVHRSRFIGFAGSVERWLLSGICMKPLENGSVKAATQLTAKMGHATRNCKLLQLSARPNLRIQLARDATGRSFFIINGHGTRMSFDGYAPYVDSERRGRPDG
jgi:hypothetical protein